ncbi:MAG: hypothetical protein JNL74_01560 [Fibrobacteres bacterium]|nr:hypothetical protein [Fibrobacterota bacterium]
MKTLIVFALGLLLTSCASRQACLLKEPPYPCILSNDIKLIQTDYLPVNNRYRDIMIQRGLTAKISVNCGIRLLYSMKQNEIFANVKYEMSDSIHYLRDKKNIIKYTTLLPIAEDSTEIDTSIIISGFKTYEWTRTSLSVGQFLSLSVFFDDINYRILYVYFPNLGKNNSYSTLEDFKTKKALFLSEIVPCLLK